jgi:hypothetical protein
VEPIKWYQSTTLRALLVAAVSQLIVFAGIAEQLPDGTSTLLVDAALQVVALVATGYAAWARARRVNPPIAGSQAAASKEGGFARPLMLAALLAVAMPVALVAPGCAAFQPAQTFEQSLAYAYGTHTALLDASANAVESGALSAEEARAVLRMADEAKLTLDTSRVAIGVGDVRTAEGQLRLATNVLTELRDYLNARMKP